MVLSARLQKTASSVFQARSFSGQSSRSAKNSPAPSPTVEKPEFLPPPPVPADRSRHSSTSRSRPNTSHGRDGSPPSSPAIQVQHASTADSLTPSSADRDERRNRRTTWFGRSKSSERVERGPAAWIVGHAEKRPYDLTSLVGAQHVSELWDEEGDCLVYLFPRTSGKGPSFRIDSSLLASSKMLSEMTIASDLGMAQMSLQDPNTPPMTPKSSSSGLQLFMPIALKSDSDLPVPTNTGALSHDDETLVAIRNFFAFLAGQSLVATEHHPTLFSVFSKLADTLKRFEFSNFDGSTFGEIATSSFDSYVDELGLADVRASREKTLEGIILGERMKNIKLYNEAFTHAVGKHDELLKLDSPKYKLISPISANRLSRAAMDLEKRTASTRPWKILISLPSSPEL